MSQTLERVIYMANQIATALRHQEPDQAAAATYDHIWHFWDPRMRRLICEHLAVGGDGLDVIARRAVERLAAGGGEPLPVTSATEFGGADDPAAASDAG
ncbi:MAG: formate dehydrogenase subunit delta [Sphingomonadaceae bacterium]|nr:formate dehydrogenase subunit delta [Sphingomonadaceae bacterium]